MLPSFGLVVTCAVLAAPAPFRRDAPLLGTTWDEKLDPDGDCAFLKQNGALVIKLPGKYHDIWPPEDMMNAPRLLNPVEGDFDAEVRVDLTGTKLSEESTVTNSHPRVAAGLLVIPEEGAVYRCEFGLSRGFVGRHFAELRGYPAGKIVRGRFVFATESQDRWTLPKGLKAAWLRLQRRGEVGQFFASSDGREWVKILSDERDLSDWKRRVKVGVFAASTSSEPFAPRFDEWKLTPVKAEKKKRD
jgi:hypothetical protein